MISKPSWTDSTQTVLIAEELDTIIALIALMARSHKRVMLMEGQAARSFRSKMILIGSLAVPVTEKANTMVLAEPAARPLQPRVNAPSVVGRIIDEGR